MAGEASIPIVLCVDVEPDERLVDRRRAAPWMGFEKLSAHVSGLRKRIEDRHGIAIRLAWFLRMDPQVKEAHGDATWAATRYGEQLEAAAAQGDDIGLHIHAYRWNDAAAAWVADHGNPDWVAECVHMSADAFRAAFQRRCGSYRMGDRYIDDATLALMESLGGRVDLTVEPGYEASPAVFLEQLHTGSLPDLRAAPRRVYRPARRDFRCVDSSGGRTIAILPLSTWRIPGLLAVARRVYVFGMILRTSPIPDVLKRQRMMTMGLSLPPLFFRRMLDDLLADESVPHLVSIDRTHIGNDPEKLDRLEVNLNSLLSHPLAHRFVFARPEEVVDSAADRDAAPLGTAAAM
jgi:hypothetical protein